MKFLTLILVGLLALPCSARLRKQWSPQELLTKADVVVLGIVESIVAVERKDSEATEVFGGRFLLHYYEASIKVSVVIKGEKVAETIRLRFSRAKSNRNLITDPPSDIALEANEIYLFYLTATENGVHLNVLHDEVDQDRSVIRIESTRAEQSAAPQIRPRWRVGSCLEEGAW
ncbi:hypothetical protein AAFN60_18155 [Roseibacillus persicicus]|uniref:hypothetical protein n=1 Tax=Roseibacillus persicicus TaxID=454148 RepID=UPI00398B7E6A